MAGTVGFFGHTHSAEYFVQRENGELPEHRPAPRGAIYDEESGQIELGRVDYDIAAAQQKIIAAGLPASMALRLSQGI